TLLPYHFFQPHPTHPSPTPAPHTTLQSLPLAALSKACHSQHSPKPATRSILQSLPLAALSKACHSQHSPKPATRSTLQSLPLAAISDDRAQIPIIPTVSLQSATSSF